MKLFRYILLALGCIATAQAQTQVTINASSGKLMDTVKWVSFPQNKLKLLDTDGTHNLIINNGANLTADRTLTLTTTGNTNVTFPTSGTLVAGDDQRLVYPAYALRKTWNKLQSIGTGGTSQLRILAVGDSMAEAKSDHIVPLLARAYGSLGTTDGQTWTLAGGATTNWADAISSSQDYSVWPTGGYFTVPAGGSVVFEGFANSAVACDEIHFFYAKESTGGTFKLQSAVGSGSFSDEAGYTNVSAANASIDLGIINIPKSYGSYKIKIVGLTGTVRVLFPYYKTTSMSGIEFYGINRGGLSLEDANTSSSTVLTKFLEDFAPDLVFFEMKEASSYFAAALSEQQSRYDAGAPDVDWIFIASSPVATNNADQIAQNTILLAHSQSSEKMFFDGYTPLQSYAAMQALGWEGDGTHPAVEAQTYLASLLTHEARFFDNRYAVLPYNISAPSGDNYIRGNLNIGSTANPSVAIIPETTFGTPGDVALPAGQWTFRAATGTSGSFLNQQKWGFGFGGTNWSHTPTWFRVGYSDPGPYIQANSATEIGFLVQPFGSPVDTRQATSFSTAVSTATITASGNSQLATLEVGRTAGTAAVVGGDIKEFLSGGTNTQGIRFYFNQAADKTATVGISADTYGSSKMSGFQVGSSGAGVFTNSTTGGMIVAAPASGSILFGNNSANPFTGSATFTQHGAITSAGVVSGLTWQGATVGAAYGGTGATSFGGTNTILYTTATNTLSAIATANNGVLITNGSGVPSISNSILGNITVGSGSASALDIGVGSTFGSTSTLNFRVGAGGGGGSLYNSSISATNYGQFTISTQASVGPNAPIIFSPGGVEGLRLASDSTSADFSGVLIAGSGNTTLTDSTGKILSAALNTVAVAQGGTGQTTYTNGQLLIGNTTGNTLTKATLTAGAGIGVTNGTGSITLNQTGMSALRTGTATLVGGTVTVNDASTTANTRVRVSYLTTGGTPGAVYMSAKSASTSFTLTSTSGADTSTLYYEAFEP